MAEAVGDANRSVSEVAASHGVTWPTTHRSFVAVADAALGEPAPTRVLGIDETRRGRPRWEQDPDTGKWVLVDRWHTGFVDLAGDGGLLGQVVGRRARNVADWLAGRSEAFRAGIEFVAVDPCAGYAAAVREALPHAQLVVDHFHLVKLANDTVTQVRQRVIREAKGRRGRLADPAWVHRRLLLRAGNTLSPCALARLTATLRTDDPTDEIGAAWGIKEQLRGLLASGSLAEAHEQKMRLGLSVLTADMPETDRLWATITGWWEAIEVLIVTGVTNARTEAANTTIKQIKRTGRGYRNTANYRARILLASAARTAA
jgi:transposase